MTQRRRFPSHRVAAEWPSPREQLQWGIKIRELLTANPKLTIIELMKLTQAPEKQIRTVKQRFLAQRAVSP